MMKLVAVTRKRVIKRNLNVWKLTGNVKAYAHRFNQEIHYKICASYAKQENNMNNDNMNNNNNMEKWEVSAMCQKPCLLFPINLILLG